MMLRPLLLLFSSLLLWAQAPGGANMAWQMQQQQQQAQQMMHLQRQMMQMVQQQLSQQRMQMQMQAMHMAQTQASLQRRQDRQEAMARRAVAMPPPLLGKPSGETWKVWLGPNGFFPAFDGTHLAVINPKPRLVEGVDLASGKELWSAALPEKLALNPTLVNGSLVYITRKFEVLALDPRTGAIQAKVPLDPLETSGWDNHDLALYPAVEGDRMFLATYGRDATGATGWIYAIEVPAGKILWKRAFGGGADLMPVLHEGRLVVGGRGRLEALDPSDGKLIWERTLPAPSRLQDGALLGARLTVLDDEGLHCVDLAKGEIAWSIPLGGRPLIQATGERFLFTEWRGVFARREWLVAVEAATGKRVWDMKLTRAWMPWVHEGRVLCTEGEKVMALEAATGKVQWSRTLPASPTVPLTPFGEAVYALCHVKKQGLLQALKLADGSPVWEATVPKAEGGSMLFLTDQGFLMTDEYGWLKSLK